MDNTFGKSFQLIKEIFNILAENKEILIFPLLAMILSCFSVFFVLRNVDFTNESSDHPSTQFISAALVSHFMIAFISVFGKAGVTAVVYQRMLGYSPTFSAGIKTNRN